MKRKLEMDVCPRTIDRRLIEGGLTWSGSVSTRSSSQRRRRRGYRLLKDTTVGRRSDWDRVLFSDEKFFLWRMDSSGRRCGSGDLQGKPSKSEYSLDQKPHPVKVNLWACFSGRGLGYSYIFNENTRCQTRSRAFSPHISSLPNHLRLSIRIHQSNGGILQDNLRPEAFVARNQAWLHNNGITCIDFPPYSPDLNPMENLWADLARRVEEKQPETMEKLQDVLAAEWEATPVSKLVKLAHSMPKRCKLVIEVGGEHIDY